MKPLVATVRAIRELATGLSPSAVSASPVLFEFETPSADYLISPDDSADVQRIILIRDQNIKEQYVPDSLSEIRRDTLSRMASFAERARIRPVSLPRGWHQYKYHNLISFFAAPRGDSLSTRWIVEILPGERSDVVYWRTTTSDSTSTLEQFEETRPSLNLVLDSEWIEAIDAGSRYFAESRGGEVSDVDMYLPSLAQSSSKNWTYHQWLDAASSDQRAFIDAPTNKSIRLKGPAGSGKTLALALKAVSEVLRARANGDNIRVLLVTHSWSLAAQITDSIERMALGSLGEVDIFPLLEIAQNLAPGYTTDTAGLMLIGEDSYSGKQAQIDEVLELLDDFIDGDWVTYRKNISDTLKARFDSSDEDARKALAWDLLNEFGSVIGASAIFPGAGAEARYFQLHRSPWMLPLDTKQDLRVVFRLYCSYMESLEAKSLVTSDQVLADTLKSFDTHTWNRARRSQGYDLVFVDEFHLFNPLERQVLHHLTRDVSTYPRVFMAADPRQSPSEAFIGVAADQTWSAGGSFSLDHLEDVANFELTTIHRFTPGILNLIKHIHHEFPTYNLGYDWDVDLSTVDSVVAEGPAPVLMTCATRAAEEVDIYRAVQELYPKGRVAVAVVEARQWQRFSQLASRINQSAKFHVSTISGRSDVEGLGYRRKGLIVGPAEYLAGLQFETVLVAGVPDLGVSTAASDKTRLLSLLYLAISRAEREVRIFVNDDDGGPPQVLTRAVENRLISLRQGSLA